MDNENEQDPPIDGEVVPDQSPLPPQTGDNWLSVVSNYTERPDLFLAEVEKHDPGFIARMNKDTETRAKETEEVRFKFSKHQAYASLVVSVVAALVILGAAWRYMGSGSVSFWPLIALGIFYAISQGGNLGFDKVVTALSGLLNKGPSE